MTRNCGSLGLVSRHFNRRLAVLSPLCELRPLNGWAGEQDPKATGLISIQVRYLAEWAIPEIETEWHLVSQGA